MPWYFPGHAPSAARRGSPSLFANCAAKSYWSKQPRHRNWRVPGAVCRLDRLQICAGVVVHAAVSHWALTRLFQWDHMTASFVSCVYDSNMSVMPGWQRGLAAFLSMLEGTSSIVFLPIRSLCRFHFTGGGTGSGGITRRKHLLKVWQRNSGFRFAGY